MSQARDTHDDIPRIWVDIRLTKRMGFLAPVAVRMWNGVKGVVFVLALAGVLYATVRPDAPVQLGLRYAMSAVIVWLFWDQVVARRHYGVSHILVTSKGVLFTDENCYVRWEEIESYQMGNDVLRVRPAPGSGPPGLFAPSQLDIPVTENNRDVLKEVFRENAKLWKPA